MPDVAKHEPGEALFAGPDGLDAYRAIIPDLPRLLVPDGVAILEIGHRQRDSAGALAAAAGLTWRCLVDLGGRDRALLCTIG